MESVAGFVCVVMVPVCAATILINRWLVSVTAADEDLRDADAVRRATRDMADRLQNLERVLGTSPTALAKDGS